uniref:Uncharacterized protein n=1 Tax=viral metagenome TaxID=1070528 RepID=A0A6M3ITS5_9ZZZZ
MAKSADQYSKLITDLNVPKVLENAKWSEEGHTHPEPNVGFTGTFLTVPPKTITVIDGLITNVE